MQESTTAFAGWTHGRDYRIVRSGRAEPLLLITGNHRVLRVSPDLAARLEAGLHLLDAGERSEWNWMADHGVVDESNRRALAAASPLDGANLAVNVNLTAACNLSCTYCFAEGGDYGRFQGRMPPSSVDAVFSLIERHVTPSRRVRFEFFGGEPLLNLERIAEICRRSDEVRRTHGIEFVYRISTNLTVLPPAAVDLFAARRFIVSVSIDGGPESHDRNRPTKGGSGSYATIAGNCRTVREASDEITMVARMTVTGGSPTLCDNVRHLWSLDLFDYFQIYPAVVAPARAEVFFPRDALRSGASVLSGSARMVDTGVLAQFDELFDLYPSLFQPGNRFGGVLEYERLLDMIDGGKLALAFCSAGRNYFTLSPDGSISACHRLAGDASLQVGAGDAIDADLRPWRRGVDDLPVCGECWARYLCGGGCKQENLVGSGSLHTPPRDLCEYQMLLAERVTRLLASQDAAYRSRDRSRFEDLFVSCGRPVAANHRLGEIPARTEPLRHFQPV